MTSLVALHLQEESCEQVRLDFTHSHRVECPLHEHLLHALETSGIVIHTGSECPDSIFHPDSSGEGRSKRFRFYSINAICSSLGEAKPRALPVSHVITGCNSISFQGKGKQSAWQAWQAYEDVTDTFVSLASHLFEHLDEGSNHFVRIARLAIYV